MSPKFAESWDLLLSDPIAESVGDPPNPSCPPQSAPALLEENRHSSQGSLDNLLRAMPASEPMALGHSNSQQHSAPTVLRCLEELRRQLDLLRRSSSVSENEFDTPRLALLNRNLEMLADAVSTTTTTSGELGPLTKNLSPRKPSRAIAVGSLVVVAVVAFPIVAISFAISARNQVKRQNRAACFAMHTFLAVM